MGEFNGIDDVEVEPQIDGPKDLEVEMVSLRLNLRNKRMRENPKDGSCLETFLETRGGLIIGVNSMAAWMIGTSLRTSQRRTWKLQEKN